MTKTFIVTDPAGLHARPATVLVNEASKFAASDITIKVESKDNVSLKSIMGVMSLAIAANQEFIIEVNGDDENEAMEALTKIIASSGIGKEK